MPGCHYDSSVMKCKDFGGVGSLVIKKGFGYDLPSGKHTKSY